MKHHSNLLERYKEEGATFITHNWGQSPTSLYNSVANAYNNSSTSHIVVITSYKQFGLKRCLDFLQEQGLICTVTGKGPKGLRLIECRAETKQPLVLIKSAQAVKFSILGHNYNVNRGEAIFSKSGIDPGTRFLLEFTVDRHKDLKGKVADFGSGWGAISIVLANIFPSAQITAFEKDEAAFEASLENFRPYSNIKPSYIDLTELDEPTFTRNKGSFDYIISNPPFHASNKDLELIFQNASLLLRPKGLLILVVENSYKNKLLKHLERLFTVTVGDQRSPYTILKCSKK